MKTKHPKCNGTVLVIFETVSLLAPPNGGIGPVINYLTKGRQVAKLLPLYPAAVIGTMPSMYQLLPRMQDGVLVDPVSGRYLDPLDFSLWLERSWGLANQAQDETLKILLPGVKDAGERRAIALDHLEKCLLKARQFQRAMDRPATCPDHLRIHIFAGRSEETPAAFLAHPFEPTVFRTEPGDETVTLRSSLRSPDLVDSQTELEGEGHLFTLLKRHVCDCTHTGIVRKTRIRRGIFMQLADQ